MELRSSDDGRVAVDMRDASRTYAQHPKPFSCWLSSRGRVVVVVDFNNCELQLKFNDFFFIYLYLIENNLFYLIFTSSLLSGCTERGCFRIKKSELKIFQQNNSML